MPKVDLKQREFAYSACVPFTKHCKIQKNTQFEPYLSGRIR